MHLSLQQVVAVRAEMRRMRRCWALQELAQAQGEEEVEVWRG